LHKDDYDLEITCSSDAALQAYLSGIDCALQLDSSGISELTEAVTHDEEFALAHAALARQFSIHGFRKESIRHMVSALSLAKRSTRREQAAIAVIDGAKRGDPIAREMALHHIDAYPQDVFVLSHLVGPFGLLAFSGDHDWPAQNVALLQETKAAYRADDWWHLSTSGFSAAETGAWEQSRIDCELAWSISENGNCAHSLTHLHFEICGVDEGKAFINEWLADYGTQSDMRHHLIWHLTLLDLESGVDIDEIFGIYDRELDPEVCDPMPLDTLSDNAAFLWRCLLAGKSASAETNKDLLAYTEKHFANIGFCFADIHRSIATALQDDSEKHSNLLSQLRSASKKSGAQVDASLTIYAQAFGTFARHDYQETVQLLEPVLPDSVLLGGSNPQRRIIEDTYVEACMRSGQFGKAQSIIDGRRRQYSTFDQDLLRRINP